MRKSNKTLIKAYNLNYLKYTNKTHKVGKYDLPYVYYDANFKPDYFALFSEEKDYRKTKNTCVCFFQNDDKFDGWCGLWAGIYFDVPEILKEYKNRMKDIKYMVAPDYSIVEDIENFENYYRIARARIVSIWATLELGIIVIPLLTYSKKEDFQYMLNGMENVSTICVSLKGSMKNKKKAGLAREAINYAVDNLNNLKMIIVYSDSIYEENERKFFEYAASKNIEVVIPMNSLKERNIINKENNDGED